MAFIAAALFASCSDDKDYSGDFGQIKVPDTRQLEQTVSADDTQSARGVTFTTEGAWTSTIAETRAEAPAWISISPDRGDAAGSYTLKNSESTNLCSLLFSESVQFSPVRKKPMRLLSSYVGGPRRLPAQI